MVKDGIKNDKIKYPSLFVDYLIENDNEFYSGEFLKKVEIDWNKFYENKTYKNEKDEEDQKE